MRVKDLVRLLNISPSYASDILKNKKQVLEIRELKDEIKKLKKKSLGFQY